MIQVLDRKVWLQELLGDKYHNIHFFKQGGTRDVYLAEWGPGKEKRVIKVDCTPNGPRAERHVSRGCTTSNDIQALSQLQEPEKHHLIHLCDYQEVEGATISVEPFVDAQSLEELVNTHPLGCTEFKAVFSQVIDGVKHLVQEAGLYHRDVKPSNILVRGERDTIDVKITDFANAGKKDAMMQKYLPTAGGHMVMDPLLMGAFTGKERAYDESSEIYAVGADMLFALTGKYLFEYDPDAGTAKTGTSGESLLDTAGRLDIKKHETALCSALKQLPRGVQQYAALLQRCLTVDEAKRYKSICALASDFKELSKPGFFESIRNSGRLAAKVFVTGVAAASLLGGALLYNAVQERKGVEQVAAENAKQLVTAGWNGANLEISNNLAELRVRVCSHDCKKNYPEDKFVTAAPGEKLMTCVAMRDLPHAERRSSMPFEIRTYIEGFPSEINHVHSESHDESLMYGEMMGMQGLINVQIPSDIEPGIHMLIVEAYQPERLEQNSGNDQEWNSVRLADRSKALSRKRVPIVVGDKADKVDVSMVRLGIQPCLYVQSIENQMNDVDKNLHCTVAAPELGYREESDGELNCINLRYGRLWLPMDRGKNATVEVVTMKGKEINGYTFFPVEQIDYTPTYKEWELALPDRSFAAMLVEYRKQILQDQSR